MQKTVEEAAEKAYPVFERSTAFGSKFPWTPHKEREAFKRGFKFAQEQVKLDIKYELEKAFNAGINCPIAGATFEEWFNQIQNK